MRRKKVPKTENKTEEAFWCFHSPRSFWRKSSFTSCYTSLENTLYINKDFLTIFKAFMLCLVWVMLCTRTYFKTKFGMLAWALVLSEDLSGDLSRSSYGKHLLADAKGTKLFVFFCLFGFCWLVFRRTRDNNKQYNSSIRDFCRHYLLRPIGRGWGERMLDGKLAGYLMETNLGKTRAISTTKKHDV